MAASHSSRVASRAYRLLVATSTWQRRRGLAELWARWWAWANDRWAGPVSVRLHGRRALVNFGYLYPVYLRLYPSYNQPLVDAVLTASERRRRPVTVVDVGAAVGDTALLLQERAGSALAAVICVDGDQEFLAYLRRNVDGLPNVSVVETMLGRSPGTVPSLVRTHRGTASAIGATAVTATTLDRALGEPRYADRCIDVLKIDVDGYDGAVLSGADQVLTRDQPDVLFEWHPVLYERASNDLLEPFLVLESHGYVSFTWFDKTGIPNGEMRRLDREEISRRAAVSLNAPEDDIHWDVLARSA